MKIVKQMVINKLQDNKENAKIDIFILPKDKEITFFNMGGRVQPKKIP